MSTLTIGHEILICDEPELYALGKWAIWIGVMLLCVFAWLHIMRKKTHHTKPRGLLRKPQVEVVAVTPRGLQNHEGHQLY